MRRMTDQPAGVDRSNLVDWMRQIIVELGHLPSEGLSTRRITPAGLGIEVHFDDPAFAESYASRFLDVETGQAPAGKVYVLMGRAPGFESLPEWQDADFSPADFHALVRAAGFRTAYPLKSGRWSFFDVNARVGVQWTASTDLLPPWDGSAPLRQHVHWILGEHGLRFAHAATLGWRDRGIVLFGKGGAGKSGTTLAGLAAGLSTVGDDYVALQGASSPVARHLYRVIKQDRKGLARILDLHARTVDMPGNWCGKVEFDPDLFFPGATVDSIALRAAILPRIAQVDRPVIVPARRQEVMLALMSSNLHQFAGEADDGMSFFARLLGGLPCFRMDLSNDAAANGLLLRDFIEGLPVQVSARALAS
jgi:hypothetical protein